MATAVSSFDTLNLPPAQIGSATLAADWVVVWPVALALCGAGLLVMLRSQRFVQLPLALAVVVAIVVSNVTLMLRIAETGPVAMTMSKWLPPFGISFAADMAGALFALAASVVTLVVVLFAQTELDSREHTFGFYPMTLLLLAGVSGSFLTGDIFNLYVWFEVMLIASFGLMVLGGQQLQIDGAVKYGFLNFLATVLFLLSIAYLYGLTGTLNFADLIAKAAAVESGALMAVAGMFIFAFSVKAAAFPANAWLPASYHTPKIAVSALFGGLLTKVGAYAVMRVLVMTLPEGRDYFQELLFVLAVVTMLLGPLGALAQTNLRRAMGFLVIGGIGTIFLGIALGSMHGIGGGVFYALHSILTLTALYLVAGLAERMTGTPDITRMGGLYGASSWLSIAFVVLMFAVSGLPPFLGFWPKILLIEGGIRAGDWTAVGAVLLNAFLTLIAVARIWGFIFWRNGPEGERSEQVNPDIRPLGPRDNALALAPALALVALIVALGLFPNWLFGSAGIAAHDILNPDRYIAAVFAEVPQP